MARYLIRRVLLMGVAAIGVTLISTAASQAYRAQFKRDGSSVRDLLSQRDAPFKDYRER